MVKSAAVLLSVLAVLVSLACGSSDAPSAATATPGAEPTSTPAGPRVAVEPRSGPPGTEVTVTGSGWEPGVLVDVTGRPSPGSTVQPYETALTDPDGHFTVRFRLEQTPEGENLSTGRFDLIARSPANQAEASFLVETRRPITGSSPGG